MTTRGVRFARDETRPVRLRREGAVGVRPGQTAARLHRAPTSGRIVASGIVIFPVLSGLFFGIVTGLAMLPRSGFRQATVMGALVGGIMLTSNAVALCIVQASASSRAVPREQRNAPDVREAQAS